MSESTNTNVDYQMTLPLELIERMMIHMDVGTVQNMKLQASLTEEDEVKYTKVLKACERRLSVTRYYDEIFGPGNGVKILTAMAKNQVYMSGSMAAEFHCPGTATSGSDCDFFIDRNIVQIYHFMNALAEVGVNWWTTIETFTNSLRRRGDDAYISTALFRQLLSDGTIHSKMNDLGISTITHTGNSDSNYCTVSIADASFLVQYHDESNEYVSSGMELTIIQGELIHGREHTPIQLIAERRFALHGYNTQALMKFHSTCTQSFIGPCSSGHMYLSLAAEKKTHGWTKIAKRTDKLPIPSTEFTVDTTNVKQWNKFESRGFTYVPVEGNANHCVIRHIMDGNASYVEYPDEIDIPYYIKDLYMAHSSTLTWFEITTGVIPVSSPVSSIRRDEILEARVWLANKTVPRTVCVEYLRRYMPNQLLLRDTVTALARLTVLGNEDSSDTDEE